MQEQLNIHYVYVTTNLINGKQYVGDHTINPKQRKYYIGSGKGTLYPAIKIYGECNFLKEILEWFPTRKEAFNAQEKYIKLFNTLTPNGYNISPTGGLHVVGCFSEYSKKKLGKSMSKALKGKQKSKEHKKNISISCIGKNKGKTPWVGKKHNRQSLKKMSEIKKGKNNPMYGFRWVNKNNEIKRIKVEELNLYIYSGWKKGRTLKINKNFIIT